MRKVRGAGRLIVALVVVATGLGLLAPAVPAGAAAGIVVSPATGLLDGQKVTVTGTGFTPGSTAEAVQCVAAWPDRCQRSPALNGTVGQAVVGDDGSFSIRLRLRRTLDPQTGPDQGCADSECSIAAIERDEDTGTAVERARVTIDFAATGTAPAPDPATLAIDLTEPARADGVTTHWTGAGYDGDFLVTRLATTDGHPVVTGPGTGFEPEPGAAILVCLPTGPEGAEECLRWRTPAIPVGSTGVAFAAFSNQPVAPDGTVDEPTDLPRVINLAAERIDCAVAGCRFALSQDDAPRSPSVGVAWAPEWAPWPSASVFVTDAYWALVGRRPTTAERNSAVADLTDRSVTGRALLRALAGRSDGRRLAELARLYDAALNRDADRGGLLYWETELRRLGGNMSAIAAAFGRTKEFRTQFGPTLSDATAVDNAYGNTLGRTASAGERAYWVGRLRAGLSRPHMVHLFSRTPEFVGLSASRSEVVAIIVTVLDRDPTLDERYAMGNGFLCKAAGGWYQGTDPCVDDVLLAVLGSDELATEVG